MKLEAVELIRVSLPLVRPFRTSFGTETVRDLLLVRCVTSVGIGWGEVAAHREPYYNEEFVDASQLVLERFLLPPLFEQTGVDADSVVHFLRRIKGYPAAKAGLEMALLDAQLRHRGVSLSTHLGGVRDKVPVGVSVGMTNSIDALLSQVANYLKSGYGRVKLKIEPGFDAGPVRAVREAFPQLQLQVDANASYVPSDHALLLSLDTYGLVMIEQPYEVDELSAHARLVAEAATPICLDESITSLRATARALDAAAADIINVKVGRLGGVIAARAVHDLCQARQIPVWCGGMLESGIGRAANVALASLPQFTYPGDLSGSARYFERDLTEPFVVEDSHLSVPSGPGLGVEVDEEFVASCATSRMWVQRT